MTDSLWNFLSPAQWSEAARKTAAMGEPATVEEYRMDMVLRECAGEERVAGPLHRRDSNLGGESFHRYE